MQGNSNLSFLTRWAVPGWVAMIAFYIFVGIDSIIYKILGADEKIKTLHSKIVEGVQIKPFDILTLAGIVVAAGVPIGFLIYQLYYFVRWNSPLSRDGFIAFGVSGRNRDIDYIFLNNSDLEESLQKYLPIQDLEIIFKLDHTFVWRYVESLLFNEIGAKNQVLYQRYLYLREITHTLGASGIAILVGFLIYILARGLLFSINVAGFLIAFFFLVITVMHLINKGRFFRDQLCLKQEFRRSAREFLSILKAWPLNIGTLKCYTPVREVKNLKECWFLLPYPATFFVIAVLLVPIMTLLKFNLSASFSAVVYVVFLAIPIIALKSSIPAKLSVLPPPLRRGIWAEIIFLILVASIVYYYIDNRHAEWIAVLSNISVFSLFLLLLHQNRHNAKRDMTFLMHTFLLKYFKEGED